MGVESVTTDDNVVLYRARGGGSFRGNGGLGTYTWPFVRLNLYSKAIEVVALGGLVRSRIAWDEVDHIDLAESSLLVVMKSGAWAGFVAFSSEPRDVVEQFAEHYGIEVRIVSTTYWSWFK